jgi:hypothetical protein
LRCIRWKSTIFCYGNKKDVYNMKIIGAGVDARSKCSTFACTNHQ